MESFINFLIAPAIICYVGATVLSVFCWYSELVFTDHFYRKRMHHAHNMAKDMKVAEWIGLFSSVIIIRWYLLGGV